MVINKICKITVKGVKLKSESFFSIFHGVLELWRKTLEGGGFRHPPPGLDRVKTHFASQASSLSFELLPSQQNYRRYLAGFGPKEK